MYLIYHTKYCLNVNTKNIEKYYLWFNGDHWWKYWNELHSEAENITETDNLDSLKIELFKK